MKLFCSNCYDEHFFLLQFEEEATVRMKYSAKTKPRYDMQMYFSTFAVRFIFVLQNNNVLEYAIFSRIVFIVILMSFSSTTKTCSFMDILPVSMEETLNERNEPNASERRYNKLEKLYLYYY